MPATSPHPREADVSAHMKRVSEDRDIGGNVKGCSSTPGKTELDKKGSRITLYTVNTEHYS